MSDDVIDNTHWSVKLDVPKFTVKLSDTINGLTKYSTFNFTLHNDDGYFDDLETTNFFNAPSYIKKTLKKNPEFDDFIPIRYGMVETIKIDDKTMTVSCADVFRTLEEPVTKVVKDIFTIATENKDENLAVVYGTVVVKVIKIGDTKYVAGENISAVSNVYDKDMNTASFTFSGGIITCSTEIVSARVTGNINNRIGQVVTDIITNKTSIQYISFFWDLTETTIYVNNSPRINISFIGGAVRDAVKNALMSDMAFLIQKNDGRFTLRQWGQIYNTFNIASWEITKFPIKDYDEAQKQYFSSCSMKYNYNFSSNVYTNTFLYTDSEDEAESTYNKLVRKEFKTYLTNDTDCKNIAIKLADRFSSLKESIKIYVGHDTSEINLLDTIKLELEINGRLFSKYTTWIVKEIDPAQDILTLESIISS
jgi:hypothetical protein